MAISGPPLPLLPEWTVRRFSCHPALAAALASTLTVYAGALAGGETNETRPKARRTLNEGSYD